MRVLMPLIALLLLVSAAAPAAAQSVPNCSMRLPALERAACLVRWHKQMTGGSVTASSSSSSAQQQVQASSASSATAATVAPVSCSRLSGIARAQCLVQQRKALLQQIAVTPPKVTQRISASRPSRLRCNRISNGTERSRCLAGN